MHSSIPESGRQDPQAANHPPRDVRFADLLSRRVVAFGVFVLLLVGIFSVPLVRLVALSLKDELHSHIVLVPAISLYVFWLKRGETARILSTRETERGLLRSSLWSGAGVIALGVIVVLWLADGGGAPAEMVDTLAVHMFGFVSILVGGAMLFFGRSVFKQAAFPLLFLIFLVPLPSTAVEVIEKFFQYASADAAAALFSLTATPVLRDGLFFRLPGIVIEVAQECSGIRSSLVLFITSLLAGYLFLRSPGKRTILALAVIPLGILRNGFRILTISLLCVHVNPGMIDSVIHHRGGPIFFVLSLVPLFLLLLLLRKIEKRQQARSTSLNGQGSMLAKERVERESSRVK